MRCLRFCPVGTSCQGTRDSMGQGWSRLRPRGDPAAVRRSQLPGRAEFHLAVTLPEVQPGLRAEGPWRVDCTETHGRGGAGPQHTASCPGSSDPANILSESRSQESLRGCGQDVIFGCGAVLRFVRERRWQCALAPGARRLAGGSISKCGRGTRSRPPRACAGRTCCIEGLEARQA